MIPRQPTQRFEPHPRLEAALKLVRKEPTVHYREIVLDVIDTYYVKGTDDYNSALLLAMGEFKEIRRRKGYQ